MTEAWRIGAVLLSHIIGAIGPIYFKKASKQFSLSFQTFTNPDLYIGIGAYGLATLLFIPALNGGDLSLLYPLVGTIYIWVSLFSARLLGERMSRRKWIGVGLIIFGVTLIGLGS